MRRLLVSALLALFAALPAAADEPGLADALPGTCRPPLRFGMSPYLDRDLLERAYRPFLEHLGHRLDVTFELIIPAAYTDMLTLLEQGRLDVAYLTPALYVQARRAQPGLRLLVADVWQGVSFYSGYLMVLTSSGITRVDDLRGRRLALVDPQSVSGWLLPRHELRARGFPVETTFAEVVASGSHSQALRLLLDHRVDVAAVSSNTLGIARNDGLDASLVRILLKTGTIPPDVICAAPTLPDDLAIRLHDALLSLTSRSPEGRAVLPRATHVNGWREGDPSEYDPILRLLDEEGTTP